jgi:ATP-dependent helicase/nuclease subunit B
VRAGKTRRNGLLLDDPAVLEAMEPGDEKRFIPVQFNKNGAYSKSSQEKLASLEQMGALSRYIDQTLRRMAQELGQGSVEADPWYRSAQDNACVHCDYKKACLFDEERDGWRIRQAMSAEQAWEKIREGCDHE